MDTLAVNYGAGLNLVDFATAPDAARLTINDWAADKTKNKILEAMPEGSIEARTRLVLTNTVYFKGAWQRPFLRKDTANGLFTRLDSSTVSTPFMRATETPVRYASLPGVTAIELPFIGEKMSMLFVMPDVGTFANYSAGFEASKFADLTNTLQSKSVIVMLPKFDFGSDIPLSRVLKALGVADAFTDDADFSGIDGKPKFLQVTSAVHKALITVDEAGAEAVGFTGFVTGPTSIPQTVVFDRPFLFLIRDVETNSVLFVGRVLDPAVK